MQPFFLALRAELYNYEKIQTDFSGVVQGRWTPCENLHVTFNYFGDKFAVEELLEKLPPLITLLQPFELSSLGCFTSNKILFATGQNAQLALLSSLIDDAFSLGETKAFIPHVTLMRMKAVNDQTAFEKILHTYDDKVLGKVESVLELMRSVKRGEETVYKTIKKFS